jgi:hypothetical protein
MEREGSTEVAVMIEDDQIKTYLELIVDKKRNGLSDEEIKRIVFGHSSSEFTEVVFSQYYEMQRRHWWPTDEESTRDGIGVLGEDARDDLWFVDLPEHSPRWAAVKRGLETKYPGDTQLIDSIDETSRRIVSLLANPTDQAFNLARLQTSQLLLLKPLTLDTSL